MAPFYESLLARGQTLSVAESCTGGLLGAQVTERAGSSSYFLGGVLVYSNELKASLLGVPPEVLQGFGAVSSECARVMASGVRRVTGSDWALAVTGIAGPGGGTPDKPVGLVYLGLAGPAQVDSRRFLFPGDRAQVRAQAVEEALAWLTEVLE